MADEHQHPCYKANPGAVSASRRFIYHSTWVDPKARTLNSQCGLTVASWNAESGGWAYLPGYERYGASMPRCRQCAART